MVYQNLDFLKYLIRLNRIYQNISYSSHIYDSFLFVLTEWNIFSLQFDYSGYLEPPGVIHSYSTFLSLNKLRIWWNNVPETYLTTIKITINKSDKLEINECQSHIKQIGMELHFRFHSYQISFLDSTIPNQKLS